MGLWRAPGRRFGGITGLLHSLWEPEALQVALDVALEQAMPYAADVSPTLYSQALTKDRGGRQGLCRGQSQRTILNTLIFRKATR